MDASDACESVRRGAPGPCTFSVLQDFFPSPITGWFGRHLSFKVCVTYADKRELGKLPLAVLINGFQCRSGWYRTYADHLASWGYAVLQYDTPLLKIIQDTVEIACLDDILNTWVVEKVGDPNSELHGRIDLSRMVIAGHSRGGKLATLTFAGSDRFKAAFLIDPVDNTRDAPESETSPNACKALRKSGKSVAMVAAGIVCACNPDGSNYKEFYKAGGEKSRLGVLHSTGHQQFLDAGPLLNRVFDWLCKAGSQSRREVAGMTREALVLYFDAVVKSTQKAGGGVALRDFDSWIAAKKGSSVHHDGTQPL